jgi:hypothetical protein
MGERIKVTLFDDIDPTKDATTSVQFEYGGNRYRIDLNDEHVAQFDAAMDHWIRHSTKLARNGKPVTKKAPVVGLSASEKKDRNAAIREWAAKKKLAVSDRGIIPAAVVEAYDKAH